MRISFIFSLGTILSLQCNEINSNDHHSRVEKHNGNEYEQTVKSTEEISDIPSFESADKSSVERADTLSAERVNKYSFESSERVHEDTHFIQSSIVQSSSTSKLNGRRGKWLASLKYGREGRNMASDGEDDKDENLKSKIATLVEQTLHDTERKLRYVRRLKEKHKAEAPYKIGFILSLIKKSKDVLNELFNVAVKHRDDYKALEQLKIFELIVHTNVDTTNLVRQMIEIHIQHVNSTGLIQNRNKVVLL